MNYLLSLVAAVTLAAAQDGGLPDGCELDINPSPSSGWYADAMKCMDLSKSATDPGQCQADCYYLFEKVGVCTTPGEKEGIISMQAQGMSEADIGGALQSVFAQTYLGMLFCVGKAPIIIEYDRPEGEAKYYGAVVGPAGEHYYELVVTFECMLDDCMGIITTDTYSDLVKVPPGGTKTTNLTVVDGKEMNITFVVENNDYYLGKMAPDGNSIAGVYRQNDGLIAEGSSFSMVRGIRPDKEVNVPVVQDIANVVGEGEIRAFMDACEIQNSDSLEPTVSDCFTQAHYKNICAGQVCKGVEQLLLNCLTQRAINIPEIVQVEFLKLSETCLVVTEVERPQQTPPPGPPPTSVDEPVEVVELGVCSQQWFIEMLLDDSLAVTLDQACQVTDSVPCKVAYDTSRNCLRDYQPEGDLGGLKEIPGMMTSHFMEMQMFVDKYKATFGGAGEGKEVLEAKCSIAWFEQQPRGAAGMQQMFDEACTIWAAEECFFAYTVAQDCLKNYRASDEPGPAPEISGMDRSIMDVYVAFVADYAVNDPAKKPEGPAEEVVDAILLELRNQEIMFKYAEQCGLNFTDVDNARYLSCAKEAIMDFTCESEGCKESEAFLRPCLEQFAGTVPAEWDQFFSALNKECTKTAPPTPPPSEAPTGPVCDLDALRDAQQTGGGGTTGLIDDCLRATAIDGECPMECRSLVTVLGNCKTDPNLSNYASQITTFEAVCSATPSPTSAPTTPPPTTGSPTPAPTQDVYIPTGAEMATAQCSKEWWATMPQDPDAFLDYTERACVIPADLACQYLLLIAEDCVTNFKQDGPPHDDPRPYIVGLTNEPFKTMQRLVNSLVEGSGEEEAEDLSDVFVYTPPEKASGLCAVNVGMGENLNTLANMLRISWQELSMLNPQLGSPDELKEGSRINYAHEYVVKAGETLHSIAARFGVTWSEILDVNPSMSSRRQVTEYDLICVLPKLANQICYS